MTDWRAYVREHIRAEKGSASIPATVIDEIATQLQDVHDAVLRSGGTPEEAVEQARREVLDARVDVCAHGLVVFDRSAYLVVRPLRRVIVVTEII